MHKSHLLNTAVFIERKMAVSHAVGINVSVKMYRSAIFVLLLVYNFLLFCSFFFENFYASFYPFHQSPFESLESVSTVKPSDYDMYEHRRLIVNVGGNLLTTCSSIILAMQ